jgi:quercetin dioxygenase-like cupin family protein
MGRRVVLMIRPVERPKLPAFFGEELPQDRALRRLGERLLSTVAELPLRYAPFFGRLSALWQAPEELVRRELTRAKDAKRWNRTLLPGLKTFDVELGGGPERGRARLLHFAPGLRFPKHRHRGSESVLVLEGSYADASGFEVHAGEPQTMPANSEHELFILGTAPCVAAVSEQGVDFTGPWLRWASRLLG